MALKRIMPCLLIQERRLVKTIKFANPNYVGDPINAVKIYNDKEVDELVLLDISVTKSNKDIDYELIEDIASECFMPLAYGGGVKTIEDFKRLYAVGIEKVIVNTLIFDDPDIVKQAANKFGNQSVVASVDVTRNSDNKFDLYSHSGRENTLNFEDHLNYIISLNVGEILITSVDNEGTWLGYDKELISKVDSLVDIPVIANGGCGKNKDLTDVLYQTNVQAAAIGSMAVYQKKDMGVLIRFPKRNQIIRDEQAF
jgi:imidazole glycerol-phosphate synthase subunit HisF